MTDQPLTIDHRQFEHLFPFHFVLDSSLRVTAVGAVFARVCPELRVGGSVNEALGIWQVGTETGVDITPEFFKRGHNHLVILRARASRLSLRMQVLELMDPTRHVFLGSPWVRTPMEMRALGLVLADFALHDSTIDLLQTVQTTAVSLGDAKQLLSKVESQRDELRVLIARASAPIIGLDADGRLTDWNSAAESVTGVPHNKAIGRPFVADFVSESSRSAAESFVANALAGGEPEPIECRVRTTGGGNALLLLGASLRHGAQNRISGLLLVGQDITTLAERRAALEGMVEERTAALSAANNDLAQAIRAKDMFLSTMSHETRTPLHGILGLLESLSLGAYGEITVRQAKVIGTITESGQHLLSLVNDILDVAKIGAGLAEIDLERGDVRALCEASVRLVNPQAQKKGINLTTHVAADATAARFDPRRMKQVLVNLLTNAIKFTPATGSVGLTATVDPQRRVIELAVKDTGIGIKPEDQQRIFQPFTQVESGHTRSYGGTGLGLTLTLRLIELHGGGLRVESEPGSGSSFVVVLPWEGLTPQLDSTEPTAVEPVAHASTVLVVAGDTRQTNTLATVAQRAGFRTIEVLDGAEAVQAVNDSHPDLVLIDIQTQLLGGIDAIGRLRSAGTTRPPEVVTISSLSIVGDEEMCLAAGASAHLVRPVPDAVIIAALHLALDLGVPRSDNRNG